MSNSLSVDLERARKYFGAGLSSDRSLTHCVGADG